MNTKILVASLATAGLAITGSVAHAEGIELGAQLQVMPFGSEVEVGAGDFSGSADLGTAFGIVGLADFAVHPNINIGAAPRLVFGIKGEDANEDADAATQLDLAARVTGHATVAPKLDVFGYASPGYSLIMIPDNEDDNPAGFILGFGGGAGYAVTPSLSVVGELGYTLGFQGVDDVDFATKLLHIGVGIKAAL
jgi:hypothetical protein